MAELTEQEQFLVNEYFQLWKEAGVEDLAGPGQRPQRTSRKKTRPTDPQRQVRTLEDVQSWLGDCRRCRLCEGRHNIVFGTGNPQAKLMFVGEGPGADEDARGEPFVGRAGQLLTKIIEAMKLQRGEVYIANVVKCRPPKNRAPLPDEIDNCLPFLRKQIEIIQPTWIVALGLYAANTLTGHSGPISSLRGRFHPLSWDPSRSVMPTYHPAYLLRNPAAKKIVWEDMKQVKAKLG
ncbi:MAG: uracil-DNA glycosylase [Deltaproteobacteria bacterium]|nr:uracil-DNA glycosylase [Deltaproteobacteria bacterium]